MFKGIKNSRLDEQDQIAMRMKVFNQFMPEGLAEDPDPVRLVQGYMQAAKGQATTVDQVLSKVLTGPDLLEYAGRMKFCLRNIQALERELQAAERRPSKWLDINRCVGAMAYLEGELKGLLFTVEELPDSKQAA